MEHFAFPGNIDFASDEQGTFSCIIHERLLCLFIVSETNVNNRWITINFPCKWHTSTTSGSKSSPRKIFHQIPQGRERRLQIQCEQWRRRRQQETKEQREHRLAQQRQHRQQETEEQETGIWEALWSFYTVENPNLLVCRFSAWMYRSKSAKFQQPEV